MNFGNGCIRARKAHTSMRKFSKENLTVKVSGAIVDAHLIPMKFRTEGKNILDAVGLVSIQADRAYLPAQSERLN